MSDIAITQAECIFILIDNAVIKDDELDKLMTNLYMKEYDLYCYIMWLLNRWARGLRKHKFHLPTHKKKDKYCVNCGVSMQPSHNFCGYCGAKKVTEINLCETL